jgi:hypothetical protein
MKRIVGLIILAFIAGNIFAQKIDQNNIPAVILNAFQVKFPTADDVDWRLDKGNYRVNFEVNDKDHEVRLDNRGRFVKHEQDLYVSEIPKVVLETIQKKVPFFDVDDADKITENGKTTFEINFEIDDKDYDFRISEKGKIIKYRKELKNSEIPTETQDFIKNKYGNLDVDRAEYNEENGKDIYYLSGEINDKDHEFTIEDNTKLLLHKQDLRNNEIPNLVLKTVKAKYRDYEIRDADLREEEGIRTYILRLRKSRENIYVIFNPKGDIIEVRKT